MRLRWSTWRLGWWLLLPGVVHAQQACDTSALPLSSPSSRFTDNRDGTVTDEDTQLMWTRCAAGQAWQEGRCTGSAMRVSWPQAQAHAGEVNRGGQLFFNDWRMPSLRELASIAERQCRMPRINLSIFPATPTAMFWTSSARPRQDGGYFVLDFGAGGIAHAETAEPHHLRLVRTAP